jgi:hypothetical protein
MAEDLLTRLDRLAYILRRIEEHIALGSERIAAQADLVATRRRKGCDVVYAEQIMAALRNCQSTLEATAWRFRWLMESDELDSGIIEQSKMAIRESRGALSSSAAPGSVPSA